MRLQYSQFVRILPLSFAFAVLLFLLAPKSQAEDFGGTYVDQNPTAFIFSNPSLVTWPNRQVEWTYKTNGRVNSEVLTGFIDQATANIERYAGIDFVSAGESALDLVTDYDSSREGTVLIEVLNNSEMDSYVADLTSGDVTNGSSFSGYAWIWWSDSILFGQIALNIDSLTSSTCWKGTITHEFGHILNLDHSDTRESIMFAEPYNSCEYQQTLRYDDISGLHQLYPKNEPNYEITIMENGCLYIPNVEFQGASYQVRELCIFEVNEGSVILNE